MYYYKVGYGTCEESLKITLRHKELLTKEALQKLVVQAMIKAAPDIDLIDCCDASEEWRYRLSVQDIMENKQFIPELKKLGFKQIDYKQTFFLFGWSDIFDIDDWESTLKDDQKQVHEQIKEALEKRALNPEKNLLPKEEEALETYGFITKKS